MLCLNDSLFFLKPIVVSQKEKKETGGGGGGGGGGGRGGGNVRSLRLKNWLSLESTNIYKVVRSQHLKDMLFCESGSFFLLNIELECI